MAAYLDGKEPTHVEPSPDEFDLFVVSCKHARFCAGSSHAPGRNPAHGAARFAGLSLVESSRPSSSWKPMTIRSHTSTRWAGARSRRSIPSLKGLPVLPFAVMAEMTAQAAALAVTPGLVLTGLTQVRAHKWVRYEDEPVYLELRGQRAPSSGDERFWVGIFNRGPLGRTEAPRPVFEAIAIFDVATPDPPPASDWSLPNSRPSKFTAVSVYAEQWLFHGPLFQAVSRVGRLGKEGIEGSIRVLPREPLVKDGQPPRFHTDFIVIDNFTHCSAPGASII